MSDSKAPRRASKVHSAERDRQIGRLLHELSRLRRIALDRLLKPFGLNRAQWSILAHLHARDGVSQTAIADELNLGRPSTGSLIDRLEQAGLVRRIAAANDRRVNIVELEGKGKVLIDTLCERSTQFDQDSLQYLPPDKRGALAAALEKLKHGLQTQIRAAPAPAFGAPRAGASRDSAGRPSAVRQAGPVDRHDRGVQGPHRAS